MNYIKSNQLITRKRYSKQLTVILDSVQRTWLKYDLVNNVQIYWQKSDDSCVLKELKRNLKFMTLKTHDAPTNERS